MTRQILRGAAAAALGAVLGALCLTGAFAFRPELALEMDRDLPRRMAAGLYSSERVGLDTFAWTGARADIMLQGLPRSSAWICAVRFRGGRGEPLPQPHVDVAIDGLSQARPLATNDYQEVEVTAPARATDGLTLSIASSTTVIPGPSDRRELGIQLDRVACRPAEGRAVTPPRRALRAAAAVAAAFGVAVVVAGATLPLAAGVGALVAAAQGWALSEGLGSYGQFPDTALRLGLLLAAIGAGLVRTLDAGLRIRLSTAAGAVLLFSAAVLYIKLLGLLHPSKLLIDALFHAHRFQTVLAGNYYFTQQMPGGVSFPYAIALYLFAAPWASFTRDHVSLLRIVVSSSEVLAGVLLYVVVMRTWQDRRAGVLAVVLFHAVPLPYGLIGNANLTNAFGQSAALAAIVAATLFRPDRAVQIAGVFLLVMLGFLSHISTAAVLGVTLVAAAAVYRLLGERSLHRTAWALLAITLAAAVFSVVTYYGHFVEVYRTLERVRPGVATSSQPEALEAAAPLPPADSASAPLHQRAVHALRLSGSVVGWPIALLAGVGAWSVWRTGLRDRLSLMLLAWGVAFLVFSGVGIVPRVDAAFERYTAEFVGRVVFATYPAAVILGAAGFLRGWGAGLIPRAGATVLLVWSLVLGVQAWARWLE